MSGKQLISFKTSDRGEKLKLANKPVWTVISAYSLVIVILSIAVPRLLIPIFPLSSLAVGIFLYRRYPIHYIGFTWWMWFLGTFIKRLIDYRCGGITPWPYHFTPLLVTSITIATLVRYLPRTYNRDGFPFFLCFITVFYGFFIGLIRQPTADYDREILILLNWLSPICFGFHLFVNWKQYPRYRQLYQQVFFWSVLVMGTYGIVQFLVAPGWDTLFMVEISSNGYSSYMGIPEPLGIRVWSTMGNPMTFAFNLIPGLILLFLSRHRLRFAAGIVGGLVLLLSQVRTAWYTTLITITWFFVSLKQRYQIRFIVAISLLILLVIPLVMFGPFSEIIYSRFETFSNIQSDGSLQARIASRNRAIEYIFSDWLGWGLIAPGQAPEAQDANKGLFSVMDNGYLMILVSFGLLAAIVYVLGIALLVTKLFQIEHYDLFVVAARAIVMGSLLRMFTSDITTEQYAMPIWGFLGVGLASYKYYKYQSYSLPNPFTKQEQNSAVEQLRV